MKEFLFEDKTENLLDLIKPSPIKKCYVVINAELGTTNYGKNEPLCSYPQLYNYSHNHNLIREELLKEAFEKGVVRFMGGSVTKKKKPAIKNLTQLNVMEYAIKQDKKKNVKINFDGLIIIQQEDGTNCVFRNAELEFCGDWAIIYTEHNGIHIFPKGPDSRILKFPIKD